MRNLVQNTILSSSYSSKCRFIDNDNMLNHPFLPWLILLACLSLFIRRTKIDTRDWEPYAFFDTERDYTRNLIATDHETYTLLLLCWNTNKESPIHDHPGDGCWMRVLRGQVRECRYQPFLSSSLDDDSAIATTLRCTQDVTWSEGGIIFIDDSLGYHKVGNPCSIPSVSLHLYSPPIQSCNVWLDKDCAPSRSNVVHYSEFGAKV
jgi:cysteine dioxygenase